MHKLFFITGNKNKFLEVKAILPEIEQLDIDLPEIQSLDPQEVIKAKLLAAKERYDGMFIVEDTGLYITAMNGFPGPLVKFVLKSVGIEGLAQLAHAFGDGVAEAKTVVGLLDARGEVHFFVGVVTGKIVLPMGDSNFGWDPVFMPDGYDKTFAELGSGVKNEISMRRKAIDSLKDFIADKVYNFNL